VSRALIRVRLRDACGQPFLWLQWREWWHIVHSWIRFWFGTRERRSVTRTMRADLLEIERAIHEQNRCSKPCPAPWLHAAEVE
jgi:hypothetical protein